MIKKLVFIFVLLMSVKVSAKTLAIDGRYFQDDEDINEVSFSFKSQEKIIYLKDYHGGYILYNDSYTIVLSGNNAMDCYSKEACITGQNIVIKDGNLMLNGSNYGIIANNVDVINSNIAIYDSSNGIKIKNKELNVNKSNLYISSKNIGIIAANTFSLKESEVSIEKSNIGITSSNNLELSLEDAKLKIHNNRAIEGSMIKKIINSTIDIKGSFEKRFVEPTNDKTITVSFDGKDYVSDDDYSKYPYVMITGRSSLPETKNEYYTKSIYVDNPNTSDNVYLFVFIFVFSLSSLLILILRSVIKTW
mgnify:FL=1